MARKRKSSPPRRCETLPAPLPELSSLHQWVRGVLFSPSCLSGGDLPSSPFRARPRQGEDATFEGLFSESAPAASGRRENSSRPSSVMSSPIMLRRGRRLLECIDSILGAAGQEKRTPGAEKKDSNDGARHPGAAQKIHKPGEARNAEPRECPHCHSHVFAPTEDFELRQVLDAKRQKLVTHCLVRICICGIATGASRAPSRLKHLRGSAPDLPPRHPPRRPRRVPAEDSAYLQGGLMHRHFPGWHPELPGQGLRGCAPHYDAIARESWRIPASHVDETPSRT